jgi:hypothetical protein
MHFDEAPGLLLVGNIFGELAIYNYVGVQSPELLSISDDFTTTCSDFGTVVSMVCVYAADRQVCY